LATIWKGLSNDLWFEKNMINIKLQLIKIYRY